MSKREKIRDDFRILAETTALGQPLVYLDNAATTHKPEPMLAAVTDYYRRSNANVHRALHTLAARATAHYEQVREQVARFIGAASAQSIVFTAGATAGINLVAAAWGRANLGPDDAVLITDMEHHSNILPWQQICRETGASLKSIPLNAQGDLDLEAAQKLVNEQVKMVAATHVSNTLGAVNDVVRLAALAHAAGARILVDAAQSVPHMPVDATQMDCDFLVFSAHKMCGPTGVGVLYGRPDLLAAMPPFMTGGEMNDTVALDAATWSTPPLRFEAGTPNIAGVVGLGAAIDYLNELSMEAVRAHECRLTHIALEKLADIAGLHVYGCPAKRIGVISFNLDGIHPHDVAQLLDEQGIAIRAGHLCAQPLMQTIHVPAMCRASFYLYNTEAEIDRLVAALKHTKAFFSHGRG